MATLAVAGGCGDRVTTAGQNADRGSSGAVDTAGTTDPSMTDVESSSSSSSSTTTPPSGETTTGSSDASSSSSSAGPEDPPPEGGLGPWGFGFEEHEDVLALWLLAADFDNDGHLDLLVNEPVDVGAIWHGDGAGGFTRGGQFGLPQRAQRPAHGDFDLDGDVDVLTFEALNGDGFHQFYNDGAGGFGHRIFHQSSAYGVVPLRLETSGATGMLGLRNYEDALVLSATHRGYWHLERYVPTVGCFFNATVVTDLDGDGADEIVSTAGCNDELENLPFGLYGHASGTLGLDQVVQGSNGRGVLFADVLATDVDGDGDPDVVTPAEDGLFVLRSEDGSLADSPQKLSHGWEPEPQRLVELSIEGRPAFVMEEKYYDYTERPPAAVVLRDGDDGWNSVTTDSLLLQGVVAGSGDFDEDGDPDLLVLGFEDQRLAVWLSGG